MGVSNNKRQITKKGDTMIQVGYDTRQEFLITIVLTILIGIAYVIFI